MTAVAIGYAIFWLAGVAAAALLCARVFLGWRKPPAAGDGTPAVAARADTAPGALPYPRAPQPGKPGQAGKPTRPPAPGQDHGRWLASIDICENTTIITNWITGESEEVPAGYGKEHQP